MDTRLVGQLPNDRTLNHNEYFTFYTSLDQLYHYQNCALPLPLSKSEQTHPYMQPELLVTKSVSWCFDLRQPQLLVS